jgi:hypothetical protein
VIGCVLSIIKPLVKLPGRQRVKSLKPGYLKIIKFSLFGRKRGLFIFKENSRLKRPGVFLFNKKE